MKFKDLTTLNHSATEPARHWIGWLLRQRPRPCPKPRKLRLQLFDAGDHAICQRHSHGLATRRQRPDRTSARLKSP